MKTCDESHLHIRIGHAIAVPSSFGQPYRFRSYGPGKCGMPGFKAVEDLFRQRRIKMKPDNIGGFCRSWCFPILSESLLPHLQTQSATRRYDNGIRIQGFLASDCAENLLAGFVRFRDSSAT